MRLVTPDRRSSWPGKLGGSRRASGVIIRWWISCVFVLDTHADMGDKERMSVRGKGGDFVVGLWHSHITWREGRGGKSDDEERQGEVT